MLNQGRAFGAFHVLSNNGPHDGSLRCEREREREREREGGREGGRQKWTSGRGIGIATAGDWAMTSAVRGRQNAATTLAACCTCLTRALQPRSRPLPVLFESRLAHMGTSANPPAWSPQRPNVKGQQSGSTKIRACCTTKGRSPLPLSTNVSSEDAPIHRCTLLLNRQWVMAANRIS